MYAIIDSGGKQYRVEEGQRLTLERLAGEVGDRVSFDRVLYLGGEEPSVGSPTVEGASVEGTIEEQGRAPKIVVFKFKRRKMYRRKQGHRQEQTVVRIESIAGSGSAGKKTAGKSTRASKTKPAAKAAAAAEKAPEDGAEPQSDAGAAEEPQE